MHGTIGTVGSYTPPRLAGPVQGRRRRSVPGLLVHRRRRRGRRRSARPAGSPSRRSGSPTTSVALDQPDAGPGSGRGQRLHGSRRGVDGGAGRSAVCRPSCPTRWCTSSPRCSSTRARRPSTCPRSITELIEGPDPERPVRRQGSRTGTRCCRSCRRWRTRSTTRSASASTRFRSPRTRFCGRSTTRREVADGECTARSDSPRSRGPRRLNVPAALGGRRRARDQRRPQTAERSRRR